MPPGSRVIVWLDTLAKLLSEARRFAWKPNFLGSDVCFAMPSPGAFCWAVKLGLSYGYAGGFPIASPLGVDPESAVLK